MVASAGRAAGHPRTPAEMTAWSRAGARARRAHRVRADDGRAARGPRRRCCARRAGCGERAGAVDLRQPDAVRAERGSRALPARSAGRSGQGGRGRHRRRVRARARATSIPPASRPPSRCASWRAGCAGRSGPATSPASRPWCASCSTSSGPTSRVFGEKDYQQLAIVRRMVTDLDMGIEIVGVPTVREPDGLAMSSRNAYLSPPERARALSLSRALFAARDAAAGGARDGARSGRRGARGAGRRSRRLRRARRRRDAAAADAASIGPPCSPWRRSSAARA